MAGVHKFTENLEATSKLYVLARWPKGSSTLRTHNSVVTCELDCIVALCAQRNVLIHIFVFDRKTAVTMLKLLGTTTRNFAARVNRCPEFVHLCKYALYIENGFWCSWQFNWSQLITNTDCHAQTSSILRSVFTVHRPWGGQGIIDSTVAHQGLDGPCFKSWWGWDFQHLSRPALRPTQLPVQCILCLF